MSIRTSATNARQLYFLKTFPDGGRKASWRLWTLIWMVPALCLVFAGLDAVNTLSTVATGEKTMGTVVEVYEWDGWTPFSGKGPVYSPVFEYTWTDGTRTTATNGMSSRAWNFAPGSQHEIWYDPDRKADIMVNRFDRMWRLSLVVGVIGLILLAPALIATRVIRRWLRDAPGKDSDQPASASR